MPKQFQYLGSLLLLLLLSTVQAENTDKTFCHYYARDLISLPQQKTHMSSMCQKNQPHWNTNKAYHTKWCLSASKEAANKKRYSHNKLVNLCDDIYKIIMVDRHRLANLLLSADETVEFQLATQQLRQALVQGSSKSPYQQYYPVVSQAINNQRLDQCDLYSLAVDMDNNTVSKEWLLMIDGGCLPEKKIGHVWLLQQLKGVYYVLFEGEDNTLTLRQSGYHGYKNIAINTRLRATEENEQRCGSIKAEWHYVAGRYLPFKGKADEHGDCLPEYNLPDYLQGENTFGLSEKTWQNDMEVEEKKRIALFAPYKKSLEVYIPQWIKAMERQIPAIRELASTVPFVAERRQEKVLEKEEKGFMQNVREFLGFSP
ncbi:MAG TPA: hypothetical protein ENJ33_04970 [Thiothrix sp.]|nr:hypothetical protein [Thiothrix sp.]